MRKIDRYSLLCISVSLIILLTLFINPGEPQDRNIIGTAYEIKTTQNGFTFSFDDADGKTIKCFNKTEPAEFGIYVIKGTFSDDGSMLFVNSMQRIHHNEF